jgi:hypothetical protein
MRRETNLVPALRFFAKAAFKEGVEQLIIELPGELCRPELLPAAVCDRANIERRTNAASILRSSR